MRGLLQKLALLLVILLTIKLPFAYFYQTESDVRRAEFAAGGFDTVFIGSSRTRHAIVPAEFDRQTGGLTRSYNLGVSGGLPPRTFDWGEDIIETSPSLRRVFFELSGGMDRTLEFDVSLRGLTWAEYYKALTTLSFDSSMIYHNKLALALFKPDLTGSYTGYNGATAAAFENEQRELRKRPSGDNLDLTRSLNQKIETPNAGPDAADPDYTDRIRRLIELAASKRVEIYFYISPRIETEEEFRILYPIYHELETKYRLNMLHHDAALYEPGTSYDDFHLNYEGAMLFTRHFAKAYGERGTRVGGARENDK